MKHNKGAARTASCRDDEVVTSAGVSAGIDMALHVVETLLGVDVANDTHTIWSIAECAFRLTPRLSRNQLILIVKTSTPVKY